MQSGHILKCLRRCVILPNLTFKRTADSVKFSSCTHYICRRNYKNAARIKQQPCRICSLYHQPKHVLDNYTNPFETLARHYSKGFRNDLMVKRKENPVSSKTPEKKKKPPVISAKKKEPGDLGPQPPPAERDLVKRPPVVTIMGHVDHGKTTLLDALRGSNVVQSEFGGITQHIGAFSVSLKSGEKITFLDTPGHAAFYSMRARGAILTDIIVLVVAAEDGVMQQTIESIEHAHNSKVPIIVAINKIDKHTANIESTKKMLLAHDVVVEDYGGDVQAVPISALKGTNLTQLQEGIIAQTEQMNLLGDPKGLMEGRVVEARTDLGRGRLVTAVIQRGTLKKGDILLSGTCCCKVRTLYDDKGKQLKSAGPSSPVEISGWKELPSPGDELVQVQTEKQMKEVIAWRTEQERELKEVEIGQKADEVRKVDRQAYLERREKEQWKRIRRRKPEKQEEIIKEGLSFPVIIKGDVSGSLEAILEALETFQSDIIRLEVVDSGVGDITEKDVELAQTFGGIVYGFNVGMVPKVPLAQRSFARFHNVIYRLFEDIKENLVDRLPMVDQDKMIGEALVLQVFKVTQGKKVVTIAGTRCIKGLLKKKATYRVMRDGEMVYQGPLSSLKHHKQEVQEIKTDVECGIAVADPNFTFQPQDEVTCLEIYQAKPDLHWDLG